MKKTVEELEGRLSRLTAQLNTLYEEKLYGNHNSEDVSIDDLIAKLKEDYFRIVDEIEAARRADYSDGELDLLVNEHKSYDDRDVYYDIRLTNTPTYIGEIRVTYVNPVKFFGDIGYELKPEYRGNGYMFKALNVLKKPLRERGLTHPKFTVYPSNVASVKTIKKFGGEKIDSTGFYDIYEVDLDLDEDTDKKVK